MRIASSHRTDIYSGLPAPFVPYASLHATLSWDPVTGYGTPILDKLLASAMKGGEAYGAGSKRSLYWQS